MGMVCCVPKVHDSVQDDLKQDEVPHEVATKLHIAQVQDEILSSKDYDSDAINLINLPTELLVKILFYLPIRDRMMMRHVSQRFRNVAEMPLLWKEFTLYCQPYLKRRHMGIMENLLKLVGEHVRKIYMGMVATTA